MARGLKLDLNRHSGMLATPEMRATIHAIAETIAARARGMADGDTIEVHDGGRSRARSYVVRLGEGALGEAEDRALLRALGGGL